MKYEYKHQCRYCSWCVFTGDGLFWCDQKDIFINNPKRPNKCPEFAFNECAADHCDWSLTYKPRKKSKYVQDKLFDIPTDKQKRKEQENGRCN